jgi:hypothetical protein
MATRPRKRSANITLVLIGAAALAGCGADPGYGPRGQYRTREACLADWNDPKDCEEAHRASSGSSHGFWYGPTQSSRGSSSSSSTSGRSSSSSSSSHPGGSVARGGFGASGHSHSSGS